MDSFGDHVADAADDAGKPIDQERPRVSSARPAAESLYGPGVPTAESFADDVPPEWLHEEDGSSDELRGVRRH